MKLFLKFDFNTVAKILLDDLLLKSDVDYKTISFGEIEILSKLSPAKQTDLTNSLSQNGIEIIEIERAHV